MEAGFELNGVGIFWGDFEGGDRILFLFGLHLWGGGYMTLFMRSTYLCCI